MTKIAIPPGRIRRRPIPPLHFQLRCLMRSAFLYIAVTCCLLVVAGCGTTQLRSGTEQLLLSDSVDRTVDQLEFSVLSGRKVFLDTTYINTVKGLMFVNADYIISAIRHKLTTSGCLIQDSKDKADYVLEARVGALGTDSLEVTYGLPACNALSTAASLVASAPVVPTIPEISVGKRNAALSTSKIVVYAYHRESGVPVWQSGTAISKSDAKDTWIMGAGPLQRGSIYKTPKFAGFKLKRPGFLGKSKGPTPPAPLTIADTYQFVHPAVLEQQIADTEAAAAAVALAEKAAKEQEAAEAAALAEKEKPAETGVVPASHEAEKPK